MLILGRSRETDAAVGTPEGRRAAAGRRLRGGTGRRWLATLLLAALVAAGGCAKYNTYFNAKRSFDQAEQVREDAIKRHEDPPKPIGTQKTNYDTAIQKAQKILDDYPGHNLTDDALFLQAKAWHRLESYRMSISKLDLLFLNYPGTEYMEEALYIQGLNYMLIGALDSSREYMDRLARNYPGSSYQAETLKVSGDNAFALEKWAEAALAYRRYLDEYPDAEERDRIGLKLAECGWELADYAATVEVLQEVADNTTSPELAFRARLLRARVHVRIGDYEVAEVLLGELRDQAEIYAARGDVRLIEAENLIAQGRGDEASPLLENMPAEWETPVVKALANDMLGYLYLDRGEWEEARFAFQEALRKRNELDDPERTRRLNESLKDFMAADQRLADAQGSEVARLQLLQANALYFGFDRPRLAVDLYTAAGADTAADSTDAARALYGGYVVYGRTLDLPDSAAMYAAELERRYPDSPQAFEVRSGGESSLLGYLLARREVAQEARLAAMTPEELAALASASGTIAGVTGLRAGKGTGLRRRMVYMQRRENIVFVPTPADLMNLTRRAEAAAIEQRRTASRDSVWAAEAAVADSLRRAQEPDEPPPPPGAEIGGAAAGAAAGAVGQGEAGGPAGGDPQDGKQADEKEGKKDDEKVKEEDEDEDEDEEEDKDKKKKDDSGGFDLRAPRPDREPIH